MFLLVKKLFPILYIYLRPFIKWFLHKFTRLCELQRICYGAKPGSSRTQQVERSLMLSKKIVIKELIRELDQQMEYCNDEEFLIFIKRSVLTVLQVKRIKPRLHPDFPYLFAQCSEQIWGYRRILFVLENLRTTQYDCENLEHEEKLLKLWSALMPDEKLDNRISKQWQDIGFQGDDPKTDFRGMGMLGLENLLYFATHFNNAARHVLLHSMHPRNGYTFAIVGINLTSMAYKLCISGRAKSHFFNITRRSITLEDFHKFYCYLFFEFDKFWIDSNPRSIMDFPLLHQRFETNILIELENDDTIFKTNLHVENI